MVTDLERKITEGNKKVGKLQGKFSEHVLKIQWRMSDIEKKAESNSAALRVELQESRDQYKKMIEEVNQNWASTRIAEKLEQEEKDRKLAEDMKKGHTTYASKVAQGEPLPGNDFTVYHHPAPGRNIIITGIEFKKAWRPR